MKIKADQKFEQDVDAIYASYIDKDFIKAKLEAAGDRNVKVKIKRDGEKVKVVTTREVKTNPPGFLKRFLKPWNKLTQTEVWKGSEGGPYKAKIQIETEGLPIEIFVKVKLEGKKKGGSAVDISTDLDCSVPLIGGKIEKVVGAESSRGLKRDLRYVAEHA